MVELDYQETERRLIELARDGDKEAFGELVQRFYPGVVAVVYRLCGEVTLAEDVAQETFVRAWLNLSSFQLPAPFRNWLYRIAVNLAFDRLRQRKALPVTTAMEIQEMADPSEDPETVVVKREQATRIQQAIQSLPPAARAVLVLREYGGLSYQEIATTLDIPPGTVMSRLSYARERLRCLLLELVEEHHA